MKTLAAILLLAAAVTLRAAPIADSSAGYSGTQGGNSWWYGYYDVAGDSTPGYNPTNNFTLMTYWDGTVWWPDNLDAAWTSLTAATVHPNGGTNNGSRPLRE